MPGYPWVVIAELPGAAFGDDCRDLAGAWIGVQRAGDDAAGKRGCVGCGVDEERAMGREKDGEPLVD
jgi:hypothetical protein